MNRKQRRAERSIGRKSLTLVIPQEISEEAKETLRAEARGLGIKHLEFEVQVPVTNLVWNSSDASASGQ